MRKTKWAALAATIREKIERGELRPGDRLPAERELVEQWKVSRMTAHRAMSELQRLGLVTRNRRHGSVVAGSKPDRGKVGLILQLGNVSMEAEYLRAFNEVFGADYQQIVCVTENDPRREQEALHRMARETRGILINPTADPGNTPLLREMVESGVPIVCLDRIPDGLDVDGVVTDNYGSTLRALRDLIARGHTRIAHFTDRQMYVSSVRERYDAYVQAMKEVGVEDPRIYSRQFVLAPDSLVYAHQVVSDALVAMLHLPEPPTAVFCLRATYMVAVLDVCAAADLRVPEDLEVLSYCEQPPWMYGSNVYRVHRIVQAMREIGQAAAQRLIQRMRGEKMPREVLRLPARVEAADTRKAPPPVDLNAARARVVTSR